MYGDNSKYLDAKVLEGESGSKIARGEMKEEYVFGPQGWATTFFPKVHQDLYFLFDSGWEIGGNSTFDLDTQKFPSFLGDPEIRLRRLNNSILNKGWRGAALWCRSTSGGDADVPLVARSQNACIYYWEIDGGDLSFHIDHIRNELGASFTIEHIYREHPLNGDWRKDGRFEI